ncbi:MAG: hypothetical protein GY711_28045 [bacterium]|nr:hypothetical protein [bacterium]
MGELSRFAYPRCIVAAVADEQLPLVSVGTDGSVRANSGAGRTYVPLDERMEVIAALGVSCRERSVDPRGSQAMMRGGGRTWRVTFS